MHPQQPKRQISRNYIYELERDQANPSLDVMQLLADTYGVTLAAIFTVGEPAAPAEIPPEYEPLEAVLRPLTKRDREGIVRNLAASVAMQQSVFGRSPGSGGGADRGEEHMKRRRETPGEQPGLMLS